LAELKAADPDRRHDVIGRTAALLGEDDALLAFSRRALLEARRRRPSLRVVQHVGYGVSIRAAAGYAWAVGFHDPRVTARGIARARRLGLHATVYTVNDPDRMRRLAELGVDGIFSDRPALLRATLSSLRPAPPPG
jgi:glycerophosphoryl diester phosphodiesterase